MNTHSLPKLVPTILAGIYIFKPGILDLIPDNEYFGMDSLIRKMIDLSLPITHYPIEEYWLDIGQAKDYEKAQEVYKEMFE